MTQVHRVFALFEDATPESSESSESSEEKETPATVKAAEAIAGPIRDEKKELAGNVAHYAMAATTGAIYGVLRELPLVASARGLFYGAAVWLVADEIVVPLLGFGAAPAKAPVASHLRGLVAHLVYGAALDGGVRVTDLVTRG